VTEVLGLDYLHFGYWEPGAPLTFENMKRAQQRYTDYLLSKIPAGVKTILDVGCGTGATAAELQKRGYQVTCLSPDVYQQSYIEKKYAGKLEFHLTKFEDFVTSKKFDLVLCSESFQYLKLPKAFVQAKSLLNSGGTLLICDYFRKNETRVNKMSHRFEDVKKHAQEQGFRLAFEEDITRFVTPTLDWGRELYSGRVLPAINILGAYANRKFPKMIKVGKFLFKKEFAKINGFLRTEGPSQLDSKAFLSEIHYVCLQFEVSKS
jgi:MPBQ/MSBQ methyltransferase